MPELRIYTPREHDFFSDVASLFIYLASLNTATEAFAFRTTTIPDSPNHSPTIAGRLINVSFEVHRLMHSVVRNEWPQELRLAFFPGNPAALNSSGGVQLQSNAAANLIIQLIGTTFLKYYERNSHRPKTAYSNNPRVWPSEWRFAWLLRNAIAHSDRWAISDSSFPATLWQGVEISSADNNRPWFDLNRYIGGGDVFLLLEELNSSSI